MDWEGTTIQINLETGRWEMTIRGEDINSIKPILGGFIVDKISLEQIYKYVEEGLEENGDPVFALRQIKAFIAPQRMVAEVTGL